MDDLLKPVKTTATVRHATPQSLPTNKPQKSVFDRIESPDDALKALRNQPDYDDVRYILKYLASTTQTKSFFSIAAPGPLAAQIINVLVSITIPDYWRSIKQSSGKGESSTFLIKCLQSVSGLGAIVSRLKPLIADAKQSKQRLENRDPFQHIEDLLDILSRILDGCDISWQIWKNVEQLAANPTQRTLLWKEYISLTASGKILSIAAQAEDALKTSKSSRTESWVAKGNDYASWLGNNAATMIDLSSGSQDDDMTATAQLCGKAFTLGYTDRIVGAILLAFLDSRSGSKLRNFLLKLPAHEQRQFLNSAMSVIARQYLSSLPETRDDTSLKPSRAISGSAGLIRELIGENEFLKDYLVSLLVSSTRSSIDSSLAVRRSAIAAISPDNGRLQKVMERSLELFGDQLYIRHTPTLQQEALAQVLLISCGYIHRSEPMFLFITARSSNHLRGMSNHIAASSPRARFLGIVVGLAISELVDKPGNRLKFELDETQYSEAKWFQQLTNLNDKVGTPEDLKFVQIKMNTNQVKIGQTSDISSSKSRTSRSTKIYAGADVNCRQITGPRIIEVEDDSEDDDLVPYGKPDSDPEDDYDDPTMIQRDKPKAPVYIRDLMSGLRDNENHDRHELAISTAASLIRRKTNFGTEVKDHIEELATILVGLNDPFELENFSEMRQLALIAVLLAQPAQMGQWFARSFFSGDYSLTQRVAMLTAMGLGARELAGFKDDDLSGAIEMPESSFPSKKLPPKLHKVYAAEATPVNSLAKRLEQTMISPMALSAADQLSGPNVLKVRTFSTRMEVEKKRKKPIPNALAAIVAQNLFFPLTGRWWTHMQASDADTLYTSPHLLPSFLQTLAILLNASGPSTLSLPQMTTEFWDLLLSVRGAALADSLILSALLFAFLMLLETNEDKLWLAQEKGKELLETQEWVRSVFERLGGKGDEEEKVRVLAAGVLIRCQEVVEKHQRTLVGDMMDY
ncbi:hypothetical protein K432DRAFT_319798 [Lepidopterella palustris CBS 459.81]|uniref:Telomere length regulation protein conserved domain-containing protein n=1 Tax=Lepidopterella palustris CBS 459.81 TaxID=1314670 RepID=A0A8E2EIK2_9PEZI|nr:hypothetical protein K432DRAFT_319798 [Lepidopterella palustris CBS 459.81]